MLEFSKLAGLALIVLAVTGPLSYCVVRDDANKHEQRMACISSKGEWTSGWAGPGCSFQPVATK